MASLLPELLFETSGQAPAPSKDFFQLDVTKTQVIWRWWKISLHVKLQSTLPGEMKQSHKEFLNDERLQKQVGMVLGSQLLEYTLGLCEGRFDYLERLPDKLLLHFLSYMSYQDICHLRQTSRRFRKLCDSNEFWEQEVRRCGDDITPEIEMLAKKFGWRRIYITFYHSKAQLGSDKDIPMDMGEDEGKDEPHESL
ncbi:F-box only protein 36a isoform X1 [Ictalurus furcatus]|uniref:F-box only protein 36a isoform X1 n=1 Tax=Ictalurus furcatus TaxID=66913 RepID=UPI0023506BCE|nr:F-box only protein 36a isoform X1 [Ictalurus furcatus]